MGRAADDPDERNDEIELGRPPSRIRKMFGALMIHLDFRTGVPQGGWSGPPPVAQVDSVAYADIADDGPPDERDFEGLPAVDRPKPRRSWGWYRRATEIDTERLVAMSTFHYRSEEEARQSLRWLQAMLPYCLEELAPDTRTFEVMLTRLAEIEVLEDLEPVDPDDIDWA